MQSSRPEITGDFMIAMPRSPPPRPEHGQNCLCMIAHRHLPANAMPSSLPAYTHGYTTFWPRPSLLGYCCYSLRVVVSKTTDLVLQTCLHPAVSSSADRPALMLNHIDRCPSRQDLRHLKIFTQALPCLPPAASNLSMTCHLSQVEFASNHSKPSPSRSD